MVGAQRFELWTSWSRIVISHDHGATQRDTGLMEGSETNRLRQTHYRTCPRMDFGEPRSNSVKLGLRSRGYVTIYVTISCPGHWLLPSGFSVACPYEYERTPAATGGFASRSFNIGIVVKTPTAKSARPAALR